MNDADTKKEQNEESSDEEIIDIPMRPNLCQFHERFHFIDDDDEEGDEEFEHCFCPKHASFVPSRFHEVLLDFFSGQQFEKYSEQRDMYDRRFFKGLNRDRFGL